MLGGLLVVSEDKMNSCGLIECFYYCFFRRKLLVSRKKSRDDVSAQTHIFIGETFTGSSGAIKKSTEISRNIL